MRHTGLDGVYAHLPEEPIYFSKNPPMDGRNLTWASEGDD